MGRKSKRHFQSRNVKLTGTWTDAQTDNFQGNANQNHNASPYSYKSGCYQRAQITIIEEGVGKSVRPPKADRNASWCNLWANRMDDSLKRLTYDALTPLLGAYSKGLIQKDTSSPQCSALFAVAEDTKQAKYALKDEWLNRMRYEHTME